MISNSAAGGLFAYVDHLLRDREKVASGFRDQEDVRPNTWACFLAFVALAVFYGAIMGAHGLLHGGGDGWKFVLASAAKLPMLFLFTLAICLPLLYVLNVLIGPRARMSVVLGLLMSSIAVTSTVLAACAPIVGFFMLSTDSYNFVKLLNVGVFALAGGYGVWYLGKGLYELSPPAPAGQPPTPAQRGTSTIITWWLVTYGVVGSQMAWLLRPFMGQPGVPFSFFRAQESNFYINLAQTLGKLLSMD